MRGVAIILAEANVPRFRTALTVALTMRALGGTARLFLDQAAVSLAGLDDHGPTAAGLPSLRQMIEEALDADVAIMLCQTGLALYDLAADALDPRCDFGGMVAFLSELGGERLLLL